MARATRVAKNVVLTVPGMARHDRNLIYLTVWLQLLERNPGGPAIFVGEGFTSPW